MRSSSRIGQAERAGRVRAAEVDGGAIGLWPQRGDTGIVRTDHRRSIEAHRVADNRQGAAIGRSSDGSGTFDEYRQRRPSARAGDLNCSASGGDGRTRTADKNAVVEDVRPNSPCPRDIDHARSAGRDLATAFNIHAVVRETVSDAASQSSYLDCSAARGNLRRRTRLRERRN